MEKLNTISDQAAARLAPSGFDPSRGVLHVRNGRAGRHPSTYGDGATWCGKKLLGKPEASESGVDTFLSYGSEVHVSMDPQQGSCSRCREAFDAAYNAAFPNGLKPIATIKADNPRAKELLGPETLTRFFGPQGEGASAYERFAASIENGGRDAGCSMGVGCDEYGVCYASAHGRPEMCPRDSDGNPKGEDGTASSRSDDSAGRQASPTQSGQE
jgi:hypothetical protein